MNTKIWNSHRLEKAERMEHVKAYTDGKVIHTEQMKEFLESIIRPEDIVVLEGDNQKQASFLSEELAKVDPEKVHDLHMVIPSVSRPEHMDIFEDGIASKLDFSYAGSQSFRIAQLIGDGTVNVGSIHTYVELYSRLFVDLIPKICLVAADQADAEGNLYTGANT